jgi:hypothetical protein
MTCPITVRLGVYALGAADAAERALVASHLATCDACRAELARLEPLSGLLARVPVSLLRTDPTDATQFGGAPVAPLTRDGDAQTGKARAAPPHWRGAAGLAAAAAIGVVGGLWLAQPGASRSGANPDAAVMLSGANHVTHVRVTAELTRTSWGTSIRLLAWGLPLNKPCRLIVRSRAGGTEVAGYWDAWRAGPISIPASAAWWPGDISSLRVATATRNLVTLTAPRPGAHARSSSRQSGSGQ